MTSDPLATLDELFAQGGRLEQFPAGPYDPEAVELAIEAFGSFFPPRPPENHTGQWAQMASLLGLLYVKRRLGDPRENLEISIGLLRSALEYTPEDESPLAWAQLSGALGSTYVKHLQVSPENRPEDLENAIEAFESALTIHTRDRFPGDWANSMNLLGMCYLDRAHGGRSANVERAVEIFQELLAATSRRSDPLGWAGFAKNLAFCHREQIWEEAGLEKAITLLKDCLQIYQLEKQPWQWADTMRELGVCWRNRLRGDHAENLEEAIACYQQAAQVFTREQWPIDWARLRNSLGIAHLDRVRGERGENLKTAIRYFQDALEVLTREAASMEWADLMDSLGLAHSSRSPWDGPESLEAAIAYHEKALEVFTPSNNPNKWAEAMNNLALTYTQKVHGGRAENLEKAFEIFEQVTTVRTRETAPLQWAQLQHNLGNIRRDRLLGEKAQNMEEAIQFFRRALGVFSLESTPVQWAISMNNLATAYRERILGDREENLEAAIRGLEQVLLVHTRHALPIQWAQTTHNLALAYGERLREDRAANLRHAAALFESILAVFNRESMPFEWANTMQSLGLIYGRLHLEEGGEANREKAEKSYRNALEIFNPETHPLRCALTAGQLGLLLMDRGAWEEAADSFRIALQASEILYRSSLLRRGRQAELAGVEGLHRSAVYAFARAGRLEEAVLSLERGRARGLNEVLARDGARLEQVRTVDPLAYSLYCEAAEHLRRLETEELQAPTGVTPEPPGEQLQRAHAALEKALDRIRRIPGYESFLRDPGLNDISPAIAPGAALAYLLTDPAGSLALVLHREEAGISVQSVWLDGLRADDLERLIFQVGNGFLAGQMNSEVLSQALAEILPILGERLMEPLSEHLRNLGAREIALVPAGLLALLPLHAAGDPCFLDEFEVSFAPSGRVLAVAQSKAGDALLPSQSPSLAGVGNPLPHPRPLTNARIELEEIATFVEEGRRKIFYGEDATEKNLLESLPGSSHVHLSCHGLFDAQDPLASHLQLAKGDRLELREILARESFSGTRLVVLSACQTALSDFQRLPDEAIGLPAGFLQTGAAGVIGTLWPVDDLSTALFMIRFYELHFEERNPPAQALGKAQTWLRDATVKEIFDWCKRRNGSKGRGGLSAAVALRLGLEEPESRCFADPLYWAPFVFVGA